MTIKKADVYSAGQAADCLQSGGVLILPTDTVYGFSGIVELKGAATAAGGGATSPCSSPAASGAAPTPSSLPTPTDEKIRRIKGREVNKPLIQLIANPSDIFLFTDVKIPESLLSKWPGPLTIIVPIKENSPYAIPENYKTVAFRCPGDKWLREVIEKAGAPIFSTSVNRSGQPVLDEMAKIRQEFGGEVDLIVDDGDKKGGIPSTLVSILDGEIKVLRQGSVEI